MNETITQKQRTKFFVMCQSAARNLGLTSRAEIEEYRHQVMLDCAGCASLKDINRKGDLDACLQRFASDAGDFLAAIDAGMMDVKRRAYVVKVMAAQVMQLKGGDEAEARNYLEGIITQAKVTCGKTSDDSFFMDVSPKSLQTLLQILDTYRRKLIKAKFPHSPMRFDDTVRYIINGPIHTRETDLPRDYYANVPFKVEVR